MSCTLETSKTAMNSELELGKCFILPRFFLFCRLNNVTKTAWLVHSFSLPLCLPVISSVSISFSFATAFTGKQSLSRPGDREGVNSSHSSEWEILLCQIHDSINYNWAISETLEVTVHSLSCKQALKNKRHCVFSYSNSSTSFQLEDFPSKHVKSNLWREDFPKLWNQLVITFMLLYRWPM